MIQIEKFANSVPRAEADFSIITLGGRPQPEKRMAWFYLLTAGALEVAATTVFRYTDGLSRVFPTVSFFVIGIASFYFLNRSLSGVPLGTAYAVWTGIGAAGTSVLGILAYGEAATLMRIALLFGLVGCIVGLKFVAEH